MSDSQPEDFLSELAKTLNGADLVILGVQRRSVAVRYEQGKLPFIVSIFSSDQWNDVYSVIASLGLPVIETLQLNEELLDLLEENTVLPEQESLYPIFARSIKLALMSHTKHRLVQFVKPLSRPASDIDEWAEHSLSSLDLDEVLSPVEIVVHKNLLEEVKVLETIKDFHAHLSRELGFAIPFPRLVERESEKEEEIDIRIHSTLASRFEITREAPRTTLGHHYSEALFRHGWRLLGYPQTRALISSLRAKEPALIAELMPHYASFVDLREVFRSLLKEQLTLNPLEVIVDAMVHHREQIEKRDLWYEAIRGELRYQITNRFMDRSRKLNALMLHPKVERTLRDSQEGVQGLQVEFTLEVLQSVAKGIDLALQSNVPPVLLCSPQVRSEMFHLIEPSYPFLPVISYAEVAPMTKVDTLALIESTN